MSAQEKGGDSGGGALGEFQELPTFTPEVTLSAALSSGLLRKGTGPPECPTEGQTGSWPATAQKSSLVPDTLVPMVAPGSSNARWTHPNRMRFSGATQVETDGSLHACFPLLPGPQPLSLSDPVLCPASA